MTRRLHGSLLSHSSSMAGKCQVQGKYLHMSDKRSCTWSLRLLKDQKGKTEIILTNAMDLRCKKEKGTLRKCPQIAPGEV